jgi:DNA-binding NtrC family response regulator
LNVVQLKLPPLRERKSDIPLLVSAFLDKFSASQSPPRTISDEAMPSLIAYDWPANVSNAACANRRRLTSVFPPRKAQEEVRGKSGEAFGEVPRHELNNPLTGILGNAELLLAEVRRKDDGRMPRGGQQRLETIGALAVRLRETVRRLSQDWEAHQCLTQ